MFRIGCCRYKLSEIAAAATDSAAEVPFVVPATDAPPHSVSDQDTRSTSQKASDLMNTVSEGKRIMLQDHDGNMEFVNVR